MKLLNKASLAETVDNVNEAIFYGKKITAAEASEIIKWVSSRLATQYSYRQSFGITSKDQSSRIYTFTGERLSSRASLRHIMAEEASRILNQLSKITRKKIPALESFDKNLLAGIKRSEAEGKPAGTYCCGPCTVGLWRNMSAGGLGNYSKKLPKGIEVLKSYRDSKGTWGRFPFYYTLLALSEVNHPAARREIDYAMPQIERRLRRMKRNSKYTQRRFDLLTGLLGHT